MSTEPMRWYFDYVSPYAYLQSTKLSDFADREPVECVPVLFAGLLRHWENVGPAEIDPKRDWTFKNTVWLAHRDGIELTLPSCHPFNPLPLLRLGIVHNNEIAVVQRLFRFVWAEGHLPSDEPAFSNLLDELNTRASDLNTPQVKKTLRDNGNTAIDRGVFGVPTIERSGEMFWGYEATDMALSHLDQDLDAHGVKECWPTQALARAASLPQGIARQSKQSPTDKTNSGPGNSPDSIPDNSNTKPRLALLPIDLQEPADVVATIRQRRGGELIELDRLLLYSTPLAAGWNHLLGNVRSEFSVSHKLRELAMCTVAVVNKADYEFSHHAPIYLAAGGTAEKTAALKDIEQAAQNQSLFETDEVLTINLALQLTRDVHIDGALFDQSRDQFNDTELVELIATIAAYNMVSRFLVAFNIT